MMTEAILLGAEQGAVDSVRTQQQSFRPFSDRFNPLWEIQKISREFGQTSYVRACSRTKKLSGDDLIVEISG